MNTKNINVKHWDNYETIYFPQISNDFFIIAGTFTLKSPHIYRLGVGYADQPFATMIPIHASLMFLDGLMSDAIKKRDNALIDQLAKIIIKMNGELNK